jgi:hypothetical protein
MKRADTTTKRPLKRLYSLKEACDYLGRTEWALRGLVKRGKISVVSIDQRVQFDVYDMDRLIEQSKRSDCY